MGRKSVQFASGWVDDEALHQALGLLQGYTHTTFDTEQDMLQRFDFDNAKLISGGDKYDVYYVKYKNFQEYVVCKTEYFNPDDMGQDTQSIAGSTIMKILSGIHGVNKIRDTFEDPNGFYCKLETFYGIALDQYLLTHYEIKSRGLPEQVCRYIVQGVLATLKKMHVIGIVHRQISMEHIQFRTHEEYLEDLQSRYEFGLISFNGSARMYSDEEGYIDLDGVVGCPGYVAPEIQQVGFGMDTKYDEVSKE